MVLLVTLHKFFKSSGRIT